MSESKKHMGRKAAVFGIATVAVLGLASPASAESAKGEAGVLASCPSTGYITSEKTCTSLSNGAVFHNRYSFAVETKYQKDGGSQVYRRLGATVSGTNYYGSWGYQSSGTTSSRTWDIDYAGCKSGIGWLEVSGQGRFQTPPTPAC